MLLFLAVGAAQFIQPLPQAKVATELAFFVVKLAVRLVGLLLQFQRAVAHVLHAQGAGNHHHFFQCAARAGLQNHAAHARVQRQFGQFVACGGDLIGIIHRTQFIQQLVTIGDGAALGALQKREVFDLPQVQRFHPQNNAGQRAAQNLRIGKFGSAVEVFLVVQADTNTVGHPATAPGPLVGAALADGLDQQLLYFAAVTVALHARQASVNDITDAGHGKRRFGHVGRNNDASVGVV